MTAHLLQSAYALLLALVLPAWAFSRLLSTRCHHSPFASWAIGTPVAIGAVTVTCFWLSRILGFSFQSVSLQITILFLALLRGYPRRTTDAAVPPRRIFQSRLQVIAFWLLLIALLLAVWFPFSRSGQVRGGKVIIPIMGDWSLISADISAIVATGVPPQNPFMASIGLIYYYFFHLYAAILVVLSGKALGIQAAGTLAAVIVAGVCFCCSFVLLREWLGDTASALFGASLVSLVGGFDFAPSLYYRYIEGAWPHNIDHWMQWTRFRIMAPLAVYQWLPQHAMGVLFFILIIYLTARGYKSWMDRFLGMICWGSLFGFSSFVAIGCVFTMGFYFLAEASRLLIRRGSRDEWHEFILRALRTLLVAAAGFALAGPIYRDALFKGTVDYTGKSLIRGLRLPPVSAIYWMQNYQPPNLFVHLLWLIAIEAIEFGPVALLGICGILLSRSWGDTSSRRLILSATIAAFLWINTVNMGGNNAGECSSKCIGIMLWWLLAMWAALFFRETWRKKGRFVSSLLILVVGLGLISSLMSLFFLAQWDYLPIDEYNAFLYLRNHTSLKALIQRTPYCDPVSLVHPAWSWRLTPYANEFLAREYLVSEKNRPVHAPRARRGVQNPRPCREPCNL